MTQEVDAIPIPARKSHSPLHVVTIIGRTTYAAKYAYGRYLLVLLLFNSN